MTDELNSVLLDQQSFGERISFSRLSQSSPHFQAYAETTTEEARVRCENADIIITNKVIIDAKTIATAKNLKLICVTATGTNNIHHQAATQRGIPICNVTHYGTPSITQHVLTLILALATKLIDYHHAVQSGHWQKSQQFCLLDYPAFELAGKTIGIIGYGELGQHVAKLAEAFEMKVLIAHSHDSQKSNHNRVPIQDLLQQSDIVTLHCPLNESTNKLIAQKELAIMKPTALLINAARGGIVDEQALATALKQGIIAGAGVDVLSTEPPTDNNPLLADDIPNLIVTPHIAWACDESRQRIIDQTVDNIRNFIEGKPKNVVNNV